MSASDLRREREARTYQRDHDGPRAKQWDLTPRQAALREAITAALRDKGAMTARQIGAVVTVDLTTVGNELNELMRAGIVTREALSNNCAPKTCAWRWALAPEIPGGADGH